MFNCVVETILHFICQTLFLINFTSCHPGGNAKFRGKSKMWKPSQKQAKQIVIERENGDSFESIVQLSKGKLLSIIVKGVQWDSQKWKSFFEYIKNTSIADLILDSIVNISEVLLLVLDTTPVQNVINFQVIDNKKHIITQDISNNIHLLFSENNKFQTIGLEGIKLPSKTFVKIGKELITNKLLSHVKLVVDYTRDSHNYINKCINYLLSNNTLLYFGIVFLYNPASSTINTQLEIEALRRKIKTVIKPNNMLSKGLKEENYVDNILTITHELAQVTDNGIIFKKLSQIYPNARKIILKDMNLSKIYRYYFEGFGHLEEIKILQTNPIIVSPTLTELPNLKNLDIEYTPSVLLYPRRYIGEKFAGLQKMHRESFTNGTTKHFYLRVIIPFGNNDAAKTFSDSFSNYMVSMNDTLATSHSSYANLELTKIKTFDRTQNYSIWSYLGESLINSCAQVIVAFLTYPDNQIN